MSNALYNTAKEAFLSGDLDLTEGNVKILLVKDSYIVDLNSHTFVSDISAEFIAGRSGILDNTTVNLGVFDADNELVSEYGNSGFSYMVIYTDTGADNTSRLVAYIDTAEGLPVEATLADASLVINWNDTASKIFSL